MSEVPLQLWNQARWELQGRVDAEGFFAALAAALPSGATLFLEGSSIADDVDASLSALAEPGAYLPARQTISASKTFRLPLEHGVVVKLTTLAAVHAKPELLDHLFVYAGSAPLLEWPDAFDKDSPILVTGSLPERQVTILSERLRTKATYVAAA